MYKKLTFNLVGISPTMIHSGRLANPFDPITRLMKEITSKRKKTDQDLKLLSDLEWLGSFYPSEDGTARIENNNLIFDGFGLPNWPGENIESMLVAAAAEQRLGKRFKAGVMVDGIVPVKFGENRTIKQLFGDDKYRDVRRVVVQRNSVMRTRPIFHNWTMRVEVNYLEDQVNPKDVKTAMEAAGLRIGLSDFRPKYGRFMVEE